MKAVAAPLFVAWAFGAAPFSIAAMDVSKLWNFADPAASEAAFREALRTTQDRDDTLTLKTQIARSLGLRARFDEAHAVLDEIEPQLAAAGPEPRVRYLLERGRAHRSAKDAERSRPLFAEAAALAATAHLDGLRIDVLHMVALVEPTPAANFGPTNRPWKRRSRRATPQPTAGRLRSPTTSA